MLLMPNIIKTDVIFWDLHQTLVDINQSKVFNHLGKWNTLRRLFSFKFWHPLASFSEYMKSSYFAALHAIPYTSTVPYDVYSDDGKTALPDILKDFMTGNITYEQAKQICDQWLKNNDFFKTDLDKELFKGTFSYNFNPTCFISCLNPTRQVSLLQRCKAEVGLNGKNHVCIVLSNWAKEQIDPFKEKFAQEIMAHIDDCIFSCDGYGCKPWMPIYRQCYDLIKKKYPEQLTQEWFFIDDQKINRDGFKSFAQNCKVRIKPKLLCVHPDQAEFMLKKYGVIS